MNGVAKGDTRGTFGFSDNVRRPAVRGRLREAFWFLEAMQVAASGQAESRQ
jgi:hypothetical protein